MCELAYKGKYEPITFAVGKQKPHLLTAGHQIHSN